MTNLRSVGATAGMLSPSVTDLHQPPTIARVFGLGLITVAPVQVAHHRAS
jgi:hypothetical protein